ncbi:hypothetical protein KFJ24_03915 [Marinobacter sediminum]|uniref:hypothetical protein n=1 Tax=Marinobacter sediminum TaxID=256323 RepID=UPI00202EDBC4|nr:hypothetical protein [Marinobacter sediminum]MCM0611622.1 hypothetical protein [Marinobacter sediminum]
MSTGLNGHPNTVIFRRDLPFVYGLTDSSQKPERQKYTDTIREFERRIPNHYRERRKEVLPGLQDRPMTAVNLLPGEEENRAENRRATSRRIIATQGRAVQLTNTT